MRDLKPERVAQLTPASRRFWAYATAFGAAWGALEITLGTFLHTLRLPFAGTLMACLGVALLVAQRQLLPARGLSLATGVVAAACKAISPGGVILGPMLGISVEAGLVELALLITPRAAVSAGVAGGLVALWPLAQKLITQLVYFGGAVVELYLEALLRSSRWLGIDDADSATVGALLLLVLAGLGVVAGLSGWRLGRRAIDAVLLRTRLAPSSNAEGDTLTHVDVDRVGAVQDQVRASRRWPDRVLLIVAVLAVVAQWRGDLYAAGSAVLLLLLALAALRPQALRRMWYPRFWLLTAVLALASGLLLGPRDLVLPGMATPLLSTEGALAGISMILRAAFVFALTSWAALAINRTTFLRWMSKLRMGSLGHAVSSALQLLPALQNELLEQRRHASKIGALRSAARTLHLVVPSAARLAERAARWSHAPLVVAVVGERRSGKSTTVQQLHRALAAAGAQVGGLSQPSDRPSRTYTLLDLASGEQRPFARPRSGPLRRRGAAGGDYTRGYLFDREGWAWGATVVQRALQTDDVVFVDELGRLEATGRGHLRVLAAPLQEVLGQAGTRPRAIVLGVQEAFAAEIAWRSGGFDRVLRLPAAAGEVEALTRVLLERCDISSLDLDPNEPRSVFSLQPRPLAPSPMLAQEDMA